MLVIKDASAFALMREAGVRLAELFHRLAPWVRAGITTAALDEYIVQYLQQYNLVSQSLGYYGYKHVSCISVDDEVVHGVPSAQKVLCEGSLVKIDVCASWKGYCADMARCFIVREDDSSDDSVASRLVQIAQDALDAGIAQARSGGRLGDISSAIQCIVEKAGCGVVRDFAGHGIGQRMHEDPEILNYGAPGKGLLIKPGMAFAIEPMITAGNYEVYVAQDGWTVRTKDRSLSAHVEDTVLVTDQGPEIITRVA